MFFLTFLMYFLVSSAVFSYGIGMNLLLSAGGHIDFKLFKIMPKLLFTVLSSCIILWFPVSMVIGPFGFDYLTPVVVFFVSVVIYNLMPSIFIFDSNGRPQLFEYLFIFGIIFLSISEGISFFDSIVISLSCIFSFFFFLFLVIAVMDRISVISIPKSRSGLPLYLVLLGLLSLFTFAVNVMWGNHPSWWN